MAKKEFLVDVTVDGDVGIGTTSPDSKLHIYANNVDAPTIVTIENGDQGVVAGQDLSKIEFLTGDLSTPGPGVAASIRTVCKNAGNIFDLAFNTQNVLTRTERMRLTGAGKLGIGNTNPSYTLDVTGTIRATGSITENSDESLKENINTIENACGKISQIRGVEYNKIGEEAKKIGVIAQEVESVVPEVVTEDADGTKSVSYTNLVGLLIQSNKELIKRVTELENIINNKH